MYRLYLFMLDMREMSGANMLDALEKLLKERSRYERIVLRDQALRLAKFIEERIDA